MGGLVVSRRVGESVRIGDNIVVTVTDLAKRSAVRLHIEAPREVRVRRFEVAQDEQDTGPVIVLGEADDRRGFVLFIDGAQVGEPVTYDDFGWGGINLAQTLILAVAKALGGEVLR